ncbi:hypothetical protein SR18_gp034c [Caulobacter phage SR18]|nr:hypothetical protein SR18_gp034c [Caulobacter phage SR18]
MSSFTEAAWEPVQGKKREGRQVYRIKGRNGDGLWFYIGFKGSGLAVHVPENFETDELSIPGAVGWLVPKAVKAKAVRSAAVHDLLCEDPRFSRPDADAQFWAAMTAEGVPPFWRKVFFDAVTTNNSKERYNANIAFDGEVQLPLPGLEPPGLGS